jgi:tripartite ATP-independent transporter DctP family solute receptor
MSLFSRRSGLAAFAAAAAFFATGPAFAQDVKQRTIKVATQNPKGHPIVTGMEKFAELATAKSGGKFTINLFPGGVLGSDQANVSALQGGTLEMVVLNSGILASQVKEFAIFDFPFMFASPKEADAIADGPFGKMMLGKLEAKDIVGLAYWELGFRNITNGRRPLNTVEDIAGLKLRVIPNAINVDWVSALGANPTPLPFPELYSALDQKAIDGQENPFTVIAANKFFEVQKHLAITNHQYNPQTVIISKKLWDTLSADEKKILSDAAAEAAVYQRQVSRQQAGEALENLKKNGMQVTEFSAAEMAKFRDKMKPVVDKHAAIVGAEVVASLQAELAKLR